MNRLFVMMGLLFILIVPQAWAQTTQYPDPNRVTMWNKFTDGVHTLGQTPQQAKQTRMRLRHTRAVVRNKSIAQAKRDAWLNSK